MADRNRLAEFSDAEIEMIRDALQIVSPDADGDEAIRAALEAEFDAETINRPIDPPNDEA